MTATPTLADYFADLPDPRGERTKQHPLLAIILIAILATICGADDFVAMEQWARAREGWLREKESRPVAAAL